MIEHRVIKPERLTDIANRRARLIGDHGSGECRAAASVSRIDILNNLFAPRVLEVDIDVGRLIALLRDKPLEQHVDTRGVDLGNTQAVTHRRIRGRPAPLTQNALAPSKGDDVVNGKKIMLVAKLFN